MDLRFSEAETAFRAEVRDFIRTTLSPELRAKIANGGVPTKAESVAWQLALNARGWATPNWPVRHGGPGWTPVQKYIFLNEIHQAPAPEPLTFNSGMIGPVLCEYGTDAQKARFLNATANADIWWAQGFSEAGAGSDLAALRTSAVRDGGAYVVTGHKMWQGMAHYADWMFTLVRTDPSAPKKQMGISLLLIDLTLPGVTIKPIVTIDRRHEVNEVYLDAVCVPADCLVGPENGGWDIAKFLLSNERTNIARAGMTKQLVRRAKAIGGAGVSAKSALIEAELKALEITQLRILAAQQDRGAGHDPRSSLLKLKGVELRQAASELLLNIAGEAALEARDVEHSVDPMATIAPNYFILRAASIYGGTTEVQKNIVAKTMLGL